MRHHHQSKQKIWSKQYYEKKYLHYINHVTKNLFAFHICVILLCARFKFFMHHMPVESHKDELTSRLLIYFVSSVQFFCVCLDVKNLYRFCRFQKVRKCYLFKWLHCYLFLLLICFDLCKQEFGIFLK